MSRTRRSEYRTKERGNHVVPPEEDEFLEDVLSLEQSRDIFLKKLGEYLDKSKAKDQ
jgi:hypothetical protein